MSISSGYDKFKDYHQTEGGSYKLTSRWTSSNTVELDDGSTVEEKFAEIDSELNNVADNKVDKVSGKGLSTNDYTTTEKTKLSGIATGAEVNQNAFSNVKVGSTTVAADSKTDTLTLAGSNVTLTPDATNDKVTIGITKANVTAALGYTPPTTNTTYGVATSSTLGLVKSGTDITVDSSGNVSVNDDSHNHVISNVDGLQGQLDSINSSLNNYLPLTGGKNISGQITINGKFPALATAPCTIMSPSQFINAYGGTLPSSYGMIFINGNSRPNSFVDDTYYFMIDSSLKMYNGIQINGDTVPVWSRKISNNDFTYSNGTLTITT